MSQENVEIVRQPIEVGTSTRRRLQERLFLRVPGVGIALTRAVFRMRPSSRLRQVMLRRALRLSVEASNRGDLEAIFALAHPDHETIPPPELVGIGFDAVYHGRDGRLRFQQQWVAELGEFQQESEEIIDLGDRVLLHGQMKGTGLSSGAEWHSEAAYLLTVSDGRVIREQLFRSHQQALEAVGLSE